MFYYEPNNEINREILLRTIHYIKSTQRFETLLFWPVLIHITFFFNPSPLFAFFLYMYFLLCLHLQHNSLYQIIFTYLFSKWLHWKHVQHFTESLCVLVAVLPYILLFVKF